VEYPGPFERISERKITCNSSKLKPFIAVNISAETDSYDFDFN
jgi:hypothetical protein